MGSFGLFCLLFSLAWLHVGRPVLNFCMMLQNVLVGVHTECILALFETISLGERALGTFYHCGDLMFLKMYHEFCIFNMLCQVKESSKLFSRMSSVFHQHLAPFVLHF